MGKKKIKEGKLNPRCITIMPSRHSSFEVVLRVCYRMSRSRVLTLIVGKRYWTHYQKYLVKIKKYSYIYIPVIPYDERHVETNSYSKLHCQKHVLGIDRPHVSIGH